MAHYDCPDCGEFRCPGGCQTPEAIAERKAYARQKAIDEANMTLREEYYRRKRIEEARQKLIREGEWYNSKYRCLFEE